ncbi:hypothetical protein KJ708_04095 [bacterium]|nr:hypothetical protein [bacterium]MBU1917539.1 hypothetical protein [bacterium]
MENVMPKAYVTKLPEGLRADETPQQYYVGAREGQLTQNCTDLASVETPIYSESCDDVVNNIYINDETGDVYVPQPDGETYAMYEMETGYGFWERTGFWHDSSMGLTGSLDYMNGNFEELTQEQIRHLRAIPNNEVYAYIIDKMSVTKLDEKPEAWCDRLIYFACSHWIQTHGADHSYYEKALAILQKIVAQSHDIKTINLAIDLYQRETNYKDYDILLAASKNQRITPYIRFNKLAKYLDETSDIKAWEKLTDLMQESMTPEHAYTAYLIAEHIIIHADDHIQDPALANHYKAEAEESLFLLTENLNIDGNTRYDALKLLSEKDAAEESKNLKRLRKGYLSIVQAMATPADSYAKSQSASKYLQTKPEEQDINEAVAEIFAPVLENDVLDFISVDSYSTVLHNTEDEIPEEIYTQISHKLAQQNFAIAQDINANPARRNNTIRSYYHDNHLNHSDEIKQQNMLAFASDPSLIGYHRIFYALMYQHKDCGACQHSFAEAIKDLWFELKAPNNDKYEAAEAFITLKGVDNLTEEESLGMVSLVKNIKVINLGANPNKVILALFLHTPFDNVREALFEQIADYRDDVGSLILYSSLDDHEKNELIDFCLDRTTPIWDWDLRTGLQQAQSEVEKTYNPQSSTQSKHVMTISVSQ